MSFSQVGNHTLTHASFQQVGFFFSSFTIGVPWHDRKGESYLQLCIDVQEAGKGSLTHAIWKHPITICSTLPLFVSDEFSTVYLKYFLSDSLLFSWYPSCLKLRWFRIFFIVYLFLFTHLRVSTRDTLSQVYSRYTGPHCTALHCSGMIRRLLGARHHTTSLNHTSCTSGTSGSCDNGDWLAVTNRWLDQRTETVWVCNW